MEYIAVAAKKSFIERLTFQTSYHYLAAVRYERTRRCISVAEEVVTRLGRVQCEGGVVCIVVECPVFTIYEHAGHELRFVLIEIEVVMNLR